MPRLSARPCAPAGVCLTQKLRPLIAACFQLGSGVHSREALIRQITRLAEGQDPRSLANGKATCSASMTTCRN